MNLLMDRTDRRCRETSELGRWLLVLSLSASFVGVAACSSSEDDTGGSEESATTEEGEDEDVDKEEDDDVPPGNLDAGNRQDAGGKDTGMGAGKDAGSTTDGGGATPKDGGLDSSGKDASASPDTGTVVGGNGSNKCGLPDVTDYVAKGPYDAKMFSSVGPSSNYTLFRPDTMLGEGGIKHPIVVWGNGIATIPDWYQTLLGHIASHGFVIIACNDVMAERPCLDAGMEWLIEQNTAAGDLQGKLDTSQEATIGYSWGGGAAIDTANRPNVVTTISFHGMPPRGGSAFTDMHSPLLLFTSTGDTFVNAAMFVTPNYDQSVVPTFYATLQEDKGHGYIIDDNPTVCSVAGLVVGGGTCEGADKEQAPAVAWLRYWMCDDQKSKDYFYGPDCILCKSPWMSQSKPAGTFM